MGMTSDELAETLGTDKETLIHNSEEASSAFMTYAQQDETNFSQVTQASMASASSSIGGIAASANTAIASLGELISSIEGSIKIYPIPNGIGVTNKHFGITGPDGNELWGIDVPLPYLS